jgi:hypothetical protein
MIAAIAWHLVKYKCITLSLLLINYDCIGWVSHNDAMMQRFLLRRNDNHSVGMTTLRRSAVAGDLCTNCKTVLD